MPNKDQQTDPMPRHYLLPPGACLTFTGNDYLARQAIEYMFAFCEVVADPQQTGTTQLTAEITINNDYLANPLPDWIDTQITQGREYREVHAFYGPEGEAAALLSNRDGFVCGLLNKEGNRIDITLGKTGNDKTVMMSPSAIFTPLLQEALQRRGNLIFHSAGLQLPDKTGIMILADSGGGKTTTALALLRKKAALLADDLVILDNSNAGPVIHGLPEPVNLTAATRNFFPELNTASSLPMRDGVTDKVVFDPRTVYGRDCFTPKTQLNIIYFVEVSDGEPTLAPISPPVALGKMIKGCTFAFHQKLAKTSGASLFDLAAKIPCFTLRTGSDPDYLGGWLQERSKAIASRNKL